jgi:hypothetical protein
LIFASVVALALASPSAALGARVLLIAPASGEGSATQREPFTLSPCPEGAGCRSAATATPLPKSAAQLELAPQIEERHWYGYQLIISDVASLGLFLVGGAAILNRGECPTSGCTTPVAGEALALAGMGTFGLVPPIIHLLHRQYWNAAGSFGLRVVIPVLTGLAFQGTGGMGLLWIELLVAMIVDDAYLADEPVPRPPPTGVESRDAKDRAIGLAYGGRF